MVPACRTFPGCSQSMTQPATPRGLGGETSTGQGLVQFCGSSSNFRIQQTLGSDSPQTYRKLTKISTLVFAVKQQLPLAPVGLQDMPLPLIWKATFPAMGGQSLRNWLE